MRRGPRAGLGRRDGRGRRRASRRRPPRRTSRRSRTLSSGSQASPADVQAGAGRRVDGDASGPARGPEAQRPRSSRHSRCRSAPTGAQPLAARQRAGPVGEAVGPAALIARPRRNSRSTCRSSRAPRDPRQRIVPVWSSRQAVLPPAQHSLDIMQRSPSGRQPLMRARTRAIAVGPHHALAGAAALVGDATIARRTAPGSEPAAHRAVRRQLAAPGAAVVGLRARSRAPRGTPSGGAQRGARRRLDAASAAAVRGRRAGLAGDAAEGGAAGRPIAPTSVSDADAPAAVGVRRASLAGRPAAGRRRLAQARHAQPAATVLRRRAACAGRRAGASRRRSPRFRRNRGSSRRPRARRLARSTRSRAAFWQSQATRPGGSCAAQERAAVGGRPRSPRPRG